jgi:SAM-dependent methyltransferase
MDTVIIILGLLVLAAILIGYSVFGWVNLTNRIGYVPVPRRLLPQIIQAMALRPGDSLADLGCGDGRVLRAAMRAEPSIKAIGFENNPIVYLIARLLSAKAIGLRRADLFACDLTDASVVFAYLHPDLNAKLKPKLERELKAGSRVLTLQFPIIGWTARQTIDLAGAPGYAQQLYVYQR